MHRRSLILTVEALALSLRFRVRIMIPATARRPPSADACCIICRVDMAALGAGSFARLAAALDTVAVGSDLASPGDAFIFQAVGVFAVGEAVPIIVDTVKAFNRGFRLTVLIVPPSAATRLAAGHASIEDLRSFVRTRDLFAAAILVLVLDANAVFAIRELLLAALGDSLVLLAVGIGAVTEPVAVVVLVVEALGACFGVWILIMEPAAHGLFSLLDARHAGGKVFHPLVRANLATLATLACHADASFVALEDHATLLDALVLQAVRIVTVRHAVLQQRSLSQLHKHVRAQPRRNGSVLWRAFAAVYYGVHPHTWSLSMPSEHSRLVSVFGSWSRYQLQQRCTPVS